MLKIKRISLGLWTEPENWGNVGEVVWQVQQQNEKTYFGSYRGGHYGPKSNIAVFFNYTVDF